MKRALVAAMAFVAAGCTGTARVYPLNDAAGSAGMPRIMFGVRGGRGPVTVTMPDGTILTGEYQVTENAAIGFAFARGAAASGVGLGGARHVVASAVAPGGHRMNCEGAIDLGGHGSLVCESETGAQWRIMV